MILLVLPDVTQDEALLAQARSGDRSAIAAIYDQYFEPIYQFTRLRVNDVQMAEDITSSVFLAFIQALKKGKGPRNHLRGWLFRVARNHIADHYGARQPLPLETVEQWFADDATSPEFHTMRTLDIETIRALIGQLSA
ncbi:MAG: sigma factor, partial [Chloroflexota bacterium]